MITEIEDYFAKGCDRCERFGTPDCSTQLWNPGLRQLRALCLAAGVTETVKWGHPCYMHAGRNIAILGAFRKDFRLTFFNAALMKDPEGLMTRQGENTRSPDMIRFDSVEQVAERQAAIAAYLREAMGYAEAGITAPKVEHDLELPDELVDALDMDPELSEAFHNLTPGRQRSYVINLASAKASATKVSRIAGFRGKILSGKGANER